MHDVRRESEGILSALNLSLPCQVLSALTKLSLVLEAWIPAFAGMAQESLSFPWKRESRGKGWRVIPVPRSVLLVGVL